jgi:hypothetical protein
MLEKVIITGEGEKIFVKYIYYAIIYGKSFFLLSKIFFFQSTNIKTSKNVVHIL